MGAGGAAAVGGDERTKGRIAMKRAMIVGVMLACVAVGAGVRGQATQPAARGGGVADEHEIELVFVADEHVIGLVFREGQRMPRNQISEAIMRLAFPAAEAKLPPLAKSPDGGWAGTPRIPVEVDVGVSGNEATVRLRLRGPNGVAVRAELEKRLRAALAEGASLTAEQVQQKAAEFDKRIQQLWGQEMVLNGLDDARRKLWPGILVELRRTAELEKQRLSMELVAKRRRADLTRQQIAEIEMEAEKKVETDPVMKLLRKAGELRQEELERVRQMFRAGAAGTSDVAKAEESVNAAEVQKLQRMETIRQGAKGDLLNRLSGELASLTIDLGEMEVRLKLVERTSPPVTAKGIGEADLARLAEEYRPWYDSAGGLAGQRDELGQQRQGVYLEKLKLTARIAEEGSPAAERK